MDREAKVDPLRQHILEAVETLRLRKCRPDRESIAHHVLRKFGSTMNEIFAELENIVDEGGLIKVEYKGTTSYRNPGSFDIKNSPLLTKHSKILNSSKTTMLMISGINELLVKDPNYTQAGVPLDELKKKLMEFDNTRFSEETINSLIEREMICGGIHIAKSDYLTESLRVFPKDIPMPSDMHNVVSLGEDNSVEIQVEVKPKKVRKSHLDPSSSLTTDKKAKKSKPIEDIDNTDPSTMDTVEQEENEEEKVEDVSSPAKKKVPIYANARSSNVGKKIVAEKVAEAVRKSYESTAEFETTSAQMIKLAEAVVAKQGEPFIEVPKGPSLVLASSIINQSNEDPNNGSTESQPVIPEEEENAPLNGSVIAKIEEGNQIIGKKGRGRVSIKQESPEKLEEILGLESESTLNDTSPIEHGLTRSKRDKRKKQVFDPSDPNTYSRSVDKKARLSESNAPLNSKSSTVPTAPIKRGKKTVPGTVDNKLPISSDVAKRRKPETLKSSNIHGFDKEVEKEEESEISIPSSTTLVSPVIKKETILYCSYCQDTDRSPSTQEGEFLTCSSCNNDIHPGCMDYAADLYARIKEFEVSRGIGWQCFECKKCGVCSEKIMNPSATSGNVSSEASNSKVVADTSSSLQIILCEDCDVGFHAKCTQDGESYNKSSNEAWICSNCKEFKQQDTKKYLKPNRFPKKKIPAGKTLKKESPKNGTEADKAAYPDDLRLWSEEDVENYFIINGLREEAANLRNQAVDGYGLLLLQREDIVNSMGFRLGPALKVYRLVESLQQKAPVQPHSSWTENLTNNDKVE